MPTSDSFPLIMSHMQMILDCTLRMLTHFTKSLIFLNPYSGLKINFDKSELIPLGVFHNNPPDISETNLEYCYYPVWLLGIIFSSNREDIFNLNYAPKLTKLKENLRIWSLRDLSPIGKITIIKSLGSSQLVFSMFCIA